MVVAPLTSGSRFARVHAETFDVDAIPALAGGMLRAQATVDVAAQQIAAADLPTQGVPDVTSPAAALASVDVDVAQQLTTMMVAADAHHLTAAAMQAALTTYRDALSLDLDN